MEGQSFFDFTLKDIDGHDVSLSQYKGQAKAFLLVNVASACGFTDGDYRQLTALYNELKEQGLEVFGFPCNQFGSQESKCELDIKAFVATKYQAKFRLFSKIDVNGANAHPLYTWLKKHSGLWNSETNTPKNIGWNFEKFIVDRDGNVKAHRASRSTPESLKPEIQALLA